MSWIARPFGRAGSVLKAGANGAGDRVHSLRDGRAIGYRETGLRDGRPVIALHGTPGSRFKFDATHVAASAHGLRVIAPDRWGYGLSSAKPGGRLSCYGADIEEFADALGLGAFAVAGISGGGPYAVAVAARCKERVTALALVSPVGLIQGGDRVVALGPLHGFCFRVAPKIPGAVAGGFHVYRAMLRLAPGLAVRVAVASRTAGDRAFLADASPRAAMAAGFSQGLEPGVAGPVTDMALFGQPWKIDMADVSARVRIWLGTHDANVPAGAVTALCAAIPQAEFIALPNAGHQWFAFNAETVMAWLARRD